MSLWLTGLCLPWLMFAALHCSSSTGPRYAISPKNVTSASGKSAIFSCGVFPASAQINFTVYGSKVNRTLRCPGNTIYISSQSMKGYCEKNKENEEGYVLATWSISGTSLTDNGTIFQCQSTGLADQYGYLWVFVDSGYFGILIGCVIGGFFGILIVFGMAYVTLQRSERLQRCFKGRAHEDDMTTIVEDSKGL